MNILETLWTYRKLLLMGLKVTIQLSLIMLVGGLILGSLAAAGLSLKSKKKPIKILQVVIRVYVEIFRGCPLLIQLFFGYFGISYLGINIGSFTACGVVLVLYAGGYICEIVRSGLEAIPKGQWEAGYCIGLNYLEIMRYSIFPQAFRIFVPSLVGFFVMAIKDTSVVSLIGCADFMQEASIVINKTGMALEIYAAVAVVYFIINYPLSLWVKNMEKRRSNA